MTPSLCATHLCHTHHLAGWPTMSQNPRTLCMYHDIAEITQKMLSHAKASEWDDVAALVPQYQNAVEKLGIIGPMSPKALEERRNLLAQILENDASIRRLASPELERLNELINGLQRQRTVLQAYYAPQS